MQPQVGTSVPVTNGTAQASEVKLTLAESSHAEPSITAPIAVQPEESQHTTVTEEGITEHTVKPSETFALANNQPSSHDAASNNVPEATAAPRVRSASVFRTMFESSFVGCLA
jgi:hypothetical protein